MAFSMNQPLPSPPMFPDGELLLRVRDEVKFDRPKDPAALPGFESLVRRLRDHSRAGYLRIVDVTREAGELGEIVSSISCLLTVAGEAELIRGGLA